LIAIDYVQRLPSVGQDFIPRQFAMRDESTANQSVRTRN